jgi:hypothetical protein
MTATELLFKVLPSSIIYNMAYQGKRHGECFPQLIQCFASRRISLPYFYHLCRFEFSESLAAFLSHILHILSVRSAPHVGVPNAAWKIAFVKDALPFWNYVFRNKPSQLMRSNVSDWSGDYSVSARVCICFPNPARSKLGTVLWDWSVLIYFYPKSIYQNLRNALLDYLLRSTLMVHKSVSLICAAPSVLQHARAFIFPGNMQFNLTPVKL